MRDRIRALIESEGPLPFERFMEIALYAPDGGFFIADQLRSQKAGDFLTSPEVSPLFGETLAHFIAEERRRLGEPFRLVEVAAGSGSLLSALLPLEPVEAWAVEISPPAREALARVVGSERAVASLDLVPSPVRGVVLANELIDNLPMAVAQLSGGEWRERWIGAEGNGLTFVDAPARPEVIDWLDKYAGPVVEGGWVEVQLEAARWVAKVLGLLGEGALVIIDYGDTAENLAPRRRDGTLRTYRAHHLGPHPLDEPGATDITADVNFTALEDVARRAGAEVEVWRQDDFLGAYGLRDRISELRHRELEAARSGDEVERLRIRTLRTEAETIVHPRGLGDFRVMVARMGTDPDAKAS
ncbi:MAG TPA: SAM-dependent methyltransferase [Acidimicrobiia bacterium]|nr:SAM-dependent methyltransferase [Acidimicrobiia bacterium]